MYDPISSVNTQEAEIGSFYTPERLYQFPLEKWFYDFLMAECGVEEPRVERLTPEYRDKPVVVISTTGD